MLKLKYILIILIFPFNVFSQDWEVGVFLGGSNYQGDIAPKLILTETHTSGGMFIKWNLNSYFSTLIGITQGNISGKDANHDHLEIRNLSFQSSIYELTAQMEFNFFPFAIGINPKNFTPYTFIGISLYRFEPRIQLGEEYIYLRPLDTEGRNITSDSRYSYYQPSIPIGGGFKFAITDKLNAGINLGYRYTFTDYLDDVSGTYFDQDLLKDEYGTLSANLSDRSGEIGKSIGFDGKQRGRSDVYDWYIFGGITISYKIRNSVCYYNRRIY